MSKLNKSGSALIMAMVVVMVFLIIIGTCFGIASSYHRRSVEEYARKQAYLNAVAVVDAIAGDLNNIKNVDTYLPSSVENPKVITRIDIPDSFENEKGEMVSVNQGTITGKIYYDKDRAEELDALYIEVVSTYSGESETVILKMRKYRTEWRKEGYSKDGKVISNE